MNNPIMSSENIVEAVPSAPGDAAAGTTEIFLEH